MPGRVIGIVQQDVFLSGVDLSPKMLLRNIAAPSGPIPPPQNAKGAAENTRRVSQGLLGNTFTQLAASRNEGVGGRVDLIG